MAAAALSAEQLSEQAALLSANRLKRQQATHVAAMAVNKADEGGLTCSEPAKELLQAPLSAMSPSILQGLVPFQRGSTQVFPVCCIA